MTHLIFRLRQCPEPRLAALLKKGVLGTLLRTDRMRQLSGDSPICSSFYPSWILHRSPLPSRRVLTWIAAWSFFSLAVSMTGLSSLTQSRQTGKYRSLHPVVEVASNLFQYQQRSGQNPLHPSNIVECCREFQSATKEYQRASKANCHQAEAEGRGANSFGLAECTPLSQ